MTKLIEQVILKGLQEATIPVETSKAPLEHILNRYQSYQAGFSSNASCGVHIAKIGFIRKLFQDQKKPSVMVLFDLQKAFDNVCRQSVFNYLLADAKERQEHLGHSKEIHWLIALYKLVSVTYMQVGSGDAQRNVKCTVGVP